MDRRVVNEIIRGVFTGIATSFGLKSVICGSKSIKSEDFLKRNTSTTMLCLRSLLTKAKPEREKEKAKD